MCKQALKFVHAHYILKGTCYLVFAEDACHLIIVLGERSQLRWFPGLPRFEAHVKCTWKWSDATTSLDTIHGWRERCAQDRSGEGGCLERVVDAMEALFSLESNGTDVATQVTGQ